MTAKEENAMALYEMRTYTLYVGKMAEAQKLYTELGFPATSMVRDGVFARETARHTARRWVSAPGHKPGHSVLPPLARTGGLRHSLYDHVGTTTPSPRRHPSS
jgi:hypothetical protein